MSPAEQIDGKIEAEGELYLSNGFWKRLEETFSESPIFDDLERILQEPEALDWYSIRDFDLSKARSDEMIMDFDGEGDIILVVSYTGKAEIKFDSPNADSFDLETYSEIRHSYTAVYLSNEAQSGDSIRILFGRGDWKITNAITEIDLSGAIRNDQLDPITDPLKIGQIIRDSHIVPHADIACEKILISATTRLDQWRSTEDYTYMDPGRILLHAATRLSDWRHPTDLTLINGGQIFTHSIEANKLSVLTHILTGAIWTNNSPAAGWVAWTDAQITYNGHTYDITDGSTNDSYIWWDFSLSTTTFQTAAAKPALTDDDCIVCYNDAGTHELVWNATLIEGRTIRTGSITTDEIMALTIVAGNIAAGTITAGKLNVATLSAITADVGTLTAGLIQSADGFTELDLDSGYFSVSDGTYVRFRAGQLNGDYGVRVRDVNGNITVDLGKLAAESDKKNLLVKVNAANPLSQIDVDADHLKLDDSTLLLENINLTINIAVVGANGRDAGAEAANTWYSIWVIHNPATDTIAGLLSTSTLAPTMPAGYTRKRRVGWVRNNGASNFLKFFHTGDWWWWDIFHQVLGTVAASAVWADVACAAYVPPTAQMMILTGYSGDVNGAGANLYLKRKGSSEDGSVHNCCVVSSAAGGATECGTMGMTISCDSDRKIEYKVFAGDEHCYIHVTGYHDPT